MFNVSLRLLFNCLVYRFNIWVMYGRKKIKVVSLVRSLNGFFYEA